MPTRGAPRRRRARPARRRVWRRERPRTRAARTLKTFGAGPNFLDSSEPIARKTGQRGTKRTPIAARAPRVPGRCRSCITRSRHVPLARLLIPSPPRRSTRAALHFPLARLGSPAGPPARAPPRGSLSRRPLAAPARARSRLAARDAMGTDTSGGGGHAAPVEDRLAGYLGVLEREAEAHGERPSVEVTCDFNYTLNLPSSKVRETRGTHSCLLYTSPSPRDRQKSRMPSSA